MKTKEPYTDSMHSHFREHLFLTHHSPANGRKMPAPSFFMDTVALKDKESRLPKQSSDFNSYQEQQNGGYKLFGEDRGEDQDLSVLCSVLIHFWKRLLR